MSTMSEENPPSLDLVGTIRFIVGSGRMKWRRMLSALALWYQNSWFTGLQTLRHYQQCGSGAFGLMLNCCSTSSLQSHDQFPFLLISLSLIYLSVTYLASLMGLFLSRTLTNITMSLCDNGNILYLTISVLISWLRYCFVDLQFTAVRRNRVKGIGKLTV